MFAQLAGQHDVIDDPSVAWPDTREKVLLGVLEIKNYLPTYRNRTKP